MGIDFFCITHYYGYMRRFLRHFFFPYESNNHKAKALHPDAMLIYILVLVVFNLAIRTVHHDFPAVLGYAIDIRVQELVNITNQKRVALGLEPLVLNTQLSQAAAKKAEDMFTNGYWAHTSPKGKTPWDFIVASGYTYTMAGENLAKNFSTSPAVVDAWMASPTHKDNIVKPGYRDVGFAVVNGILNGEETTLVVQMFGASNAFSREQSTSPVVIGPQGTQRTLGEAIVETNPQTIPEQNTFMATLSSVTSKPIINIPTLTKDIILVFVGILVVVLVIDGYIVYKKQLVRVGGNTWAHVLFLAAICIILLLVKRGAVL